MIRRRSILIAAPPASASDVSLWETFLLSSFGGAWRPDEIIRIDNGDQQEILTAIDSSKGVDYCFVIAIGRGETTRRDRPWRETHLIVGDNSKVSERELNNGSPKCFLFFDCCVAKRSSAVLAAIPEIQRDLCASREAYEKAVMSAEGGLVKLIATTVQNGPVSPFIIREAIDWAAGQHGILSLPEAVDHTVKITSKQGASRQLEYLPGRRLHHFPFAISA